MRMLLSVVLSALPCAAQATWVVDARNGPGTNFTDLQAAVNAAARGDIIRLRGAGIPPNGVSYQAPVIDGKGLSIVGDGGASTCVNGTITVSNLPASDRLRVGGFHFGDWTATTTMADFLCQSNAGLILIEDVVAFGNQDPTQDFTDCAQVVLRNIQSTQRSSYKAIRSNLTIEDCHFAPQGGFWVSASPPCLTLENNSRGWIVNSYLEGFSGPSPTYFQGGDAIALVESEVFVGPGTTLVGGRWFDTGARYPIADYYELNNTSCGVSCGFRIQPSKVHRDPGVQMVGQYPNRPHTLDDLRPVTTVRSIVATSTLTIHHRCTPLAVTLLGAGPLLAGPWPSVEGLLSIDPAQAFAWFAPVSSGGNLQWDFAIPPNLAAGFWLGLQGVELRPNGSLGVTNLTTFSCW